MKYKYEKKFDHNLKLSQQQLDKVSALHVVDLFMGGWFGTRRKFEDIENMNPEWVKIHKFKKINLWHIKELEKNGLVKQGFFNVKKTKKGYVLEMKFNWRSKGMETIPCVCVKCKKVKELNDHYFCEKCTNDVGGSNGIYKFWRNL